MNVANLVFLLAQAGGEESKRSEGIKDKEGQLDVSVGSIWETIDNMVAATLMLAAAGAAAGLATVAGDLLSNAGADPLSLLEG